MFKRIVLGIALIACQSMAVGLGEDQKPAQKDATTPKTTETDSCPVAPKDLTEAGKKFLKKGACPSSMKKLDKAQIAERQK